jgi:hypothetical protein
MILKINRKSKGKRGVVEYLLNEREEEGTAITLRGNADITKALIRNIERKHKYLSGGLMFAKEEYINDEQKQEIMNAFEEVLFAGIDDSKYNILWVEHLDKERIELNFVVPRIALDTGYDLDLYSHRRDLPLMDMWKNGINVKYKLADPNDPRRSRSMRERAKVSRGDGYVVANRKNLDETLHQLVKSSQIQSRNQMIELLEKSGYQITRKNDESISVKHSDIGIKALRLKGGIYSETFRSIRGINEVSTERERRIETYDNKVARGETRPDRSTYQKYLQSRIDRHKKRYAKDTQITTQKPKYIEGRGSKNMVAKSADEANGEVEYDGIREFIEESRRRREESLERARNRKTALLNRIEELDIQLQDHYRRAEQELQTSLKKSRAVMETYTADHAERIDTEIEHSETKNRGITGRIRELLKGVYGHFEEFKKSIKGVVKKIKLFRQASEDLLLNEGQNMRER